MVAGLGIDRMTDYESVRGGTAAAESAVADSHMQRFSVPYEYPVVFCHDVFAPDNPLLAELIGRLNESRVHRAQVFVDDGVARAQPELLASIGAYFAAHDGIALECPPEVVPGGEKAKNSRQAAECVMESVADHHMCRQSFVIAVGGGSALDIIGLAAALVHRGLRLIRIPTTVLAQDDSGVGVKNGIDAYGMKNFAGTFAPPFAVIIDFAFLRTLAWRYWIGGVAEAFKVAIIRDRDFFDFLVANANRLRDRDETVIEKVVRRSALLHLEHIRGGGDPFEFGAARPLDFGHWSAHRLEVLSGYEIGHGQAVAIGIALDAFYAWRGGLIDREALETILTALESCGLPIWSSVLERRAVDGRYQVLAGLDEFREHLGGRLTVTLPAPVGRRQEVHAMDADTIAAGIEFLSDRAKAGGPHRGRVSS